MKNFYNASLPTLNGIRRSKEQRVTAQHHKNFFKRFLLSSMLMLLFAAGVQAQVTTSGINGVVKDSQGETLIGATVQAIHQPSGTTYGTTTNAEGQFTIPNMRVGGPYTVNVSYIGFNTRTYNGLNLTLGNPLRLDVALEMQSNALSEVTIVSDKNSVISAQRNGTATNVSQEQISELPTISRSVQDFARLTPQASAMTNNSDGSPMGVTFAGQSNKFNQFTVDGANANDAFGLSASGTNGGQAAANPIPLESVQELQVLLSPYEVTQGGFTGGGINAVTKSGTNAFHGSAYTYYQNQDFIGEGVTTDLKYADFSKKTYGASLGGPILKNKLFFFANAERIESSTPLPFNPAEAGSGSKFDVETLQSIRDYVRNTYNYDLGGFTDINKEITSTSLFARLDWNISNKHKLTLRHSYIQGDNDALSRSANSITFANSGYTFSNNQNSSVIELNSNFDNNTSNVFRVTYNRIRDSRKTGLFPNVSIQSNSLNYNLGSDYSSARNSLDQDNFTLVDNFTIYKGAHTITIGTNNEFYNTNNVFLQNYYGSYTYKDVEVKDANGKVIGSIPAYQLFMENKKAPSNYYVGFSTKGGNDDAASVIHAAQFGLYAQDVWNVTDRFRLTYGLRVDMPVFFNKPDENELFNKSEFASKYDVATNKPPKTTLYYSPRVGFNLDVNGDGATQLRGGAGLFTGRVPFVWISNQYGGTGVASIRYSTTGSKSPDLRFEYDPTDTHLGSFIPSEYKTAATEINVTDRNFKFPQVFRTNLAVDQQLPWWGLVGTLEGMYTKTLNNIEYKNLNLKAPEGDVTIGNSTRPWYSSRISSDFTDVIYLTNTSKGYSYNFTAQLQKPMERGWTGSIAYTYGHSMSLNDGTSSTAMSNWRYAYNVDGLNNLDLARSNYDLGSRVVGYASKTVKYGRFATTVGLVYTGQSGSTLSYLYDGNINGDDLSGNTNDASLFYVPATFEEANLVAFTRDGKTVAPEQQWADFQAFVADNEYLKDNMGKVTERNGDRMPWENHFDLKIAQDIYVVKDHKLQLGIDVINVSNLLNKDWGWSYYQSNQSMNIFQRSGDPSQTPGFKFDITKMNEVEGKLKPYTVSDYGSRWKAQVSLRYSF
ncbi:hypothetical protein CA264_13450 [Pontibacter actiniarum]|uniref:TonB-dependent receptor n=2 Tax=Pontibacter actiniarum TaxID=323450 RepID=A0A1X9YU11_9BACT|nr:hypothetical protein CA264_13450 [Pontibacter actiniarum]